MLVLTRRTRQNIYVRDKESNEVITIGIAEIRGECVRIGIEASQRYEIVRDDAGPKGETA